MPNTTPKVIWNILIIFMVLYTATIAPFRLAFILDTEENADKFSTKFFTGFDILVDIIFGIDIVVNFLSAYEKSDGRYEYGLKAIAINYTTSFFLIDFMAILPIDLIMKAFGNNQSNDVNSLLRIARLQRLYRLFRLVRLLKIANASKHSALMADIASEYFTRNTIRIMQLFSISAMCIHLFSCFFYLTANF